MFYFVKIKQINIIFKLGDKVFDVNREYGDGFVQAIHENGLLIVKFSEHIVSYFGDGRWLSDAPITLFKKEKMKNYYFVGQKVSHQAFGDGEVKTKNNGNAYYPITVEFQNHTKTFTIDGKIYEGEFPSLSQKPHAPLELEEIVTFEKGELVWMKIITWVVRHYSHFDGENHYIFRDQLNHGSTAIADNVRKFSDNPLI